MRKYYLYALALVLLSCSKEQQSEQLLPVSGDVVLTAYADDESESKTVRQPDGSVYWKPGDQISVFYGSGDDGGDCFTSTLNEIAAISNFTGKIGVITGGGEIAPDQTYFWGVYPYNPKTSCDGKGITTILPDIQTPEIGTFANGSFLTMGRSEGLSMAFFNICGGIRFTVSNSNIRKVTIRNISGESIAGTVRVEFDDTGKPVVKSITDGTDVITVVAPDGGCFVPGEEYYASVPPVSFPQGIEIKYHTTNREASYSTAATTIQRSKFSSVRLKDDGKEFILKEGNIDFVNPTFKAYCVENFDANADGEISYAEAMSVNEISVSEMADLSDIVYFESLEMLNCVGGENGRFSNLDLSHNKGLRYLDCSRNNLETLESLPTSLVRLIVSENNLNSLDLRGYSNLESLSCSGNGMEQLELGALASLSYLYCNNNNLSSVPFLSCSNLTSLSCAGNQFSSLDLSGFSKLTEAYIGDDTMESISLSPSITNLRIYYVQMHNLDITPCQDLNNLELYNARISSLDISDCQKLSRIYIRSTSLESIDLADNKQLENLRGDYCSISSLTLSNPKLASLTFMGCQIPELDLSGAPALKEARLVNCNLTNLDIKNNTELTVLYCTNNRISSLDISNNQALQTLSCGGNLLRTLDVSKNPNLVQLYCAPMNDENGNNLLEHVYIFEGQSIRYITYDRMAEYIPAETEVSLPVPDGGNEGTGDGDEL